MNRPNFGVSRAILQNVGEAADFGPEPDIPPHRMTLTLGDSPILDQFVNFGPFHQLQTSASTKKLPNFRP